MDTKKLSGASLNRGKSEQVVETPREFLDAVEKRFGKILFDLAATSENTVTHLYGNGDQFFGPGSTHAENSLDENWRYMPEVLWINPPFGNIGPWAAKCAEQSNRRGWILLLVPGSIGANWWRDYVRDKAMVYAIQPRLTFVGSTSPYPKDLALCASGYGVRGEANWSRSEE